MTVPSPFDTSGHRLVLVRPFASPAGEEWTYLANGVSDELIWALSHVHALRVIARGTAAALDGAAASPLEAAAVVGASTVVSGSVMPTDGRLLMRAEVLDARDPARRDTAAVEVGSLDFAAGVSRLADRVLAFAGADPGGAWRDRVSRARTANAEALDLLLRGRFHTEERPIGVKLAMQCFDRAIRLDGGVAEAFGALALLWANFGIFLALPPLQAAERAREQAQRALALDPDEPWARAALMTNATFYDWDLPLADRLGDALLAHAPSFVLPRQVLLYAHAARGHRDEVRRLGREVLQLDPRSVDPPNDYAFALLLTGGADEAVDLLSSHVTLHPAASEVHRRLGLALLAAGDGRRAVRHLERSVTLSRRHAWGVANLAAALARTGDASGARALLAELEERSEGELVPAVAVAEVHASLGDHDAAFGALERSLEARDYWLLALAVDPLLASLRGDGRFPALLARCLPRTHP